MKPKGLHRLLISSSCRGSHLMGHSGGKGANFSWRKKTGLCAKGGKFPTVSVTPVDHIHYSTIAAPEKTLWSIHMGTKQGLYIPGFLRLLQIELLTIYLCSRDLYCGNFLSDFTFNQ